MLKETIGILREQLRAKDDQLRDKHQENQELIRGNRESIATVNMLTKRLMVTDGGDGIDPNGKAATGTVEDALMGQDTARGKKSIHIAGVGRMELPEKDKRERRRGFFKLFK